MQATSPKRRMLVTEGAFPHKISRDTPRFCLCDDEARAAQKLVCEIVLLEKL